MRFKVGQKVRARVDGWFNKGELLEIVKVDRPDVVYKCKGKNGALWQDESEIEPLDEIREYLESAEDFKGDKQEDYMRITIETDGHYKTTAECNGVTAESLCSPTDEFKLPKGVHMAVRRLLEKIEEPEEDTCFRVGDIVEVVANEYGFRGDPIGLQGVVKDVDEDGARINIPISGSPLYFYDHELKLIRRGNN